MAVLITYACEKEQLDHVELNLATIEQIMFTGKIRIYPPRNLSHLHTNQQFKPVEQNFSGSRKITTTRETKLEKMESNSSIHVTNHDYKRFFIVQK